VKHARGMRETLVSACPRAPCCLRIETIAAPPHPHAQHRTEPAAASTSRLFRRALARSLGPCRVSCRGMHAGNNKEQGVVVCVPCTKSRMHERDVTVRYLLKEKTHACIVIVALRCGAVRARCRWVIV